MKSTPLAPLDDAALLELAADLARAAGSVIMAVRARGFDIARKQDASPVTEADRAAEAVIVAGLRGATPDIPVIAEEEMAASDEAGETVAAPPGRFWLVDPLDGTREFSQLRDEFAVCIGLVRDGQAVLGAVSVPARGEVFAGRVGAGAWKSDAAGRRPIHVRRAPAEGLTVLASRHHGRDQALEGFLAGPVLAGRKIAGIVHMGSAVKFCRLAEGVADFYPRLGRTMEWDTAAPQAVLEAAGGTVVQIDGTRLRYGKPGWENPNFYCSGR